MKKKLLSALMIAFVLTGCTPATERIQEEPIFYEEGDNIEKERVIDSYDLSDMPEYDGSPSIVINHNTPFFSDEEMTSETFIDLSELDSLGRCGAAMMCAGSETLPTEERGEIGHVKPSGWNQEKYPGLIEQPGYLYNRGHLLMYALSGLNDDERNLFTSTRYLNIEGMLEHETMVLEYIETTGEHVMYRVTPIYEENNLLASGVLMEARSVESDRLAFCRYAYNVQPGVEIDYRDGSSKLSGNTTTKEAEIGAAEETYIGNRNSKVFHLPDCESVQDTKPQNRISLTESRYEVIADGYTPCQRCNPE